MSYCRLSDKSDVYVWHGVAGTSANLDTEPDTYNIMLAYEKRVHIRQRGLVQDFSVDSPMKAATILMALRGRGVKVPAAAIKQLIEEARAK